MRCVPSASLRLALVLFVYTQVRDLRTAAYGIEDANELTTFCVVNRTLMASWVLFVYMQVRDLPTAAYGIENANEPTTFL